MLMDIPKALHGFQRHILPGVCPNPFLNVLGIMLGSSFSARSLSDPNKDGGIVT